MINNAIWIAHGIDNNKFLGALHQTFTGKTACISHVAVIPEGRGRHVGQVLLDTFIEKIWKMRNIVICFGCNIRIL